MNCVKAVAAKAATALTAAVVLICGAGQAQSEYQFSPERELVIATKEAPPFVMKRSDGTLSGISIDLLRQIAEQLHLRYRFSERETVQELLKGIEEPVRAARVQRAVHRRGGWVGVDSAARDCTHCDRREA